MVGRLKDQRTIREDAKYIAAAKKLIASIYIRDELLFRMSTKKAYYSTAKRKQVWLTPKTLTLFSVKRELEMVEIVQGAVPPMKMKKDRFGKGLTTVYSATSAFHELLSDVTTKEIAFDTAAPFRPSVLKPLPLLQDTSSQHAYTLTRLHAWKFCDAAYANFTCYHLSHEEVY